MGFITSSRYILIYAAIAAVLASMFGAGWVVNGWRWDAKVLNIKAEHAKVLLDIAGKTLAASTAAREAERSIGVALATSDAKYTKELADEKAETQRLRDCVRAGTCGVRVITRYADQPVDARSEDATPGSMGSDAVALDGPVSERVLDLRESIAEDAAKLGYLREYAEQCGRGSSVPP